MTAVQVNEEMREVRIDAEAFAEWVVANERDIERHARSGHYTLSPVTLFVTTQLGRRQIARYHHDTNAFEVGGELYQAPDWVRNFEGALVWRAGGEDKPVSVDQILEALADALYFECVKVTVRQRQRS
jgi:hypothetical protein